MKRHPLATVLGWPSCLIARTRGGRHRRAPTTDLRVVHVPLPPWDGLDAERLYATLADNAILVERLKPRQLLRLLARPPSDGPRRRPCARPPSARRPAGDEDQKAAACKHGV